MYDHKKIQSLEDFFQDLEHRREKGVYFYRIHGYNEQIDGFIRRYYEAARRSGVVIEGRIPNPDERNLAYYNEIMGMDFQMSMGFLTASLKKWLPRMNDFQRNQVAGAIYDSLENLRRDGKNDNMLKNAYIKFMCWLYYKFERIVNQLGEGSIPKILYEGTISRYELMLISILSNAGCDVVLLQYGGDGEYLKLDAASKASDSLVMSGMTAFPQDFSLKRVRERIQQEQNQERLYGAKPAVANCTNAWIKGEGLEDVRTPIANRGNDPAFYYNCFCRISGVEDKLTYLNELYQFYLELKDSARKLLILEGEIPQPTMEEIGNIHRKSYQRLDQMLLDLQANFRSVANAELSKLMVKAFVEVMLAESELLNRNLNRLTNKAVYLLCWIKRYQGALFAGWKMPDVGCFIYLGGCKNENEALFVKFLARLPVDVLILNPNRNVSCCLKDALLYEINHETSMVAERFPKENSQIQIGTTAYHAERELDTLMYQDSGIYRDRQYVKANVLTLQTMYEEIALLWKEELKYRPNFSTVNDTVNMPVIFAKVSGVKNGAVSAYWSGVKALLTEDTMIVKYVPFIRPTDENPFRAYAAEFFKNGKVQKARLKGHKDYPYGMLREEIQEYMLDKLQILIDSKRIRGTFENGAEYAIVATVLNMGKDIVRKIQKFDFTKTNPKLVYIHTGECVISLEDSILAAYLNLIGFDVIFFVPTGYQTVEKYFNGKLMEEHQIGDYMYDLRVPDFGRIPSSTRPSWRDKFFKRGT